MIERVTGYLSRILLIVLSWVVPKSTGKWVFASPHFNGSYAGNSKAVFEHLANNFDDYPECREAIFVMRDGFKIISRRNPTMRIRSRRRGYRICHWLLPFVSAELAFIDTGIAWLGLSNTKCVQLWHGSGFKNIGASNLGRKISKLTRWATNRHFDSNTVLIAASSPDDMVRKQLAFNSNRVIVTGAPKNDILFSDSAAEHGRAKQILYAPTFRESGVSIPFNASEWNELNALMKRMNTMLVIKRHPKDQTGKPVQMSNVRDVTLDETDIQELMLESSMLITDYSGIATDFVATGRPVIYFMHDMEEYLRHRTFYYDLRSTLPGPFPATFHELCSYLTSLEWFAENEYRLSYNSFRKRMHSFADGRSSHRVLSALRQVMYVSEH